MIKLIERCRLRKANSQDMWAIRWLVLSAFLEPTQLKVEQFWVIEFDNNIIACGQLRRFEKAQELGSVVVKKQWRNQGLGSYLTQYLIQQATLPLYVECLGETLKQFYEKNGFVEVNFHNILPSIQKKFQVTSTVAKWLKLPLHIMVLNKTSSLKKIAS